MKMNKIFLRAFAIVQFGTAIRKTVFSFMPSIRNDDGVPPLLY